jgi:hypothetical protein
VNDIGSKTDAMVRPYSIEMAARKFSFISAGVGLERALFFAVALIFPLDRPSRGRSIVQVFVNVVTQRPNGRKVSGQVQGASVSS